MFIPFQKYFGIDTHKKCIMIMIHTMYKQQILQSFFFISFFLFLLSWLFPEVSGFFFFEEGEGMLLLKRGHVNYQYLLAHMVSNIKLILILLFLFSVFFLLSPIFVFLIFSVSYFSKWLCHFILWNVFNHFFLFLTS